MKFAFKNANPVFRNYENFIKVVMYLYTFNSLMHIFVHITLLTRNNYEF